MLRTISAAGATLLALTACSSTTARTTTTTHTTSTGTAPATSVSSTPAFDYASLLVTPADIPVPGVTRQSASAPPQGTGVTSLFVDPSGTRKLGDTILVLDSAAASGTAEQAAAQAAKTSLSHAVSQASSIGTSGMVLSGTTNGGSTASTVLVFSEGRAYVVLEFDSAANDPVPASIVEQVGTKQDQLIKDKLPQ